MNITGILINATLGFANLFFAISKDGSKINAWVSGFCLGSAFCMFVFGLK